MSLSAPAPPQAADPSQVANTQAQYNVTAGTESQAGSAVNQINPYGSLTYTQTGTGPGNVPLYTATTQLSPAQQQLLNTLQSTQTTAEQQAGNLIGGAGYGSSDPAATIGGATSGTTQALLGQETSYLQPFFGQQTSQLDTKLRSQGFDPSDPAYQQAMNNLQQSQNQSVTGFLASAEPAAYSQAVQSYELPLTTATAELGISQPGSVGANLVQTPQLNVAAPNYAAAVTQQENVQEQTYQNQLAQQNAMMSGLFGLGGTLGTAAIKYSDCRLKRDIQHLFDMASGIALYSFRYIWSAGIEVGVMADDVMRLRPWAVSHDANGYAMVDYREALR